MEGLNGFSDDFMLDGRNQGEAQTREGNIIGPIDMLLAAQAISKDLILVTNNIKEFERIANLKLENWV